jgi:hypothetical protein
MKNKNIITRVIFPFILIFLAGYFMLQSASHQAPERDVYFEYSAKCNLWEVRNIETGTLLSSIGEGIKQVYELSDTRYAPLIKIDDEIIGHKMDGVFDWTKPFYFTFIDGTEASKIYGKDAQYGLAEFNYDTAVHAEFAACTSNDDTDYISGLPLILYDGTISKKPKNIQEERAYNGLHILTGLTAIEAYGERAESRPVFNHYKTDAVSEKRENDKTLKIGNGSKGKIIIDYTSDRLGEIDVLINQEFEQLVTTRHIKSEKSIRLELDPSDWPPYNFTISVYKAGTDYGIDSRIHRITDGKIEIDYITEDNNRRKYADESKPDENGNTINYVSIPGEQLRLPEAFYRQINYVINSNLFKVGDSDFVSYWHHNLRNKYPQAEYKRYVTTRFLEEAEDLGYVLSYKEKTDQFSITSQDNAIKDIEIMSWLHRQNIPSALVELATQEWDTQTAPLIIHNSDIITRDQLLELLNQTPLTISRFLSLDAEQGSKRFGKDGKNGVMVFKRIQTSDKQNES